LRVERPVHPAISSLCSRPLPARGLASSVQTGKLSSRGRLACTYCTTVPSRSRNGVLHSKDIALAILWFLGNNNIKRVVCWQIIGSCGIALVIVAGHFVVASG
jgi:hypothetical protein